MKNKYFTYENPLNNESIRGLSKEKKINGNKYIELSLRKKCYNRGNLENAVACVIYPKGHKGNMKNPKLILFKEKFDYIKRNIERRVFEDLDSKNLLEKYYSKNSSFNSKKIDNDLRTILISGHEKGHVISDKYFHKNIKEFGIKETQESLKPLREFVADKYILEVIHKTKNKKKAKRLLALNIVYHSLFHTNNKKNLSLLKEILESKKFYKPLKEFIDEKDRFIGQKIKSLNKR